MVLALTIFRETNLLLAVAVRGRLLERRWTRLREIRAQGLYSDILNLNR
jgi:hypothetical protein